MSMTIGDLKMVTGGRPPLFAPFNFLENLTWVLSVSRFATVTRFMSSGC